MSVESMFTRTPNKLTHTCKVFDVYHSLDLLSFGSERHLRSQHHDEEVGTALRADEYDGDEDVSWVMLEPVRGGPGAAGRTRHQNALPHRKHLGHRLSVRLLRRPVLRKQRPTIYFTRSVANPSPEALQSRSHAHVTPSRSWSPSPMPTCMR